MKIRSSAVWMAVTAGMFFLTAADGQQVVEPAISPAKQALAQASAQRRYAHIVFYRADDDATRAMAQVVTAIAGQHPDSVVPVYVSIADPAEQPLVQQFAVARAPMPIVIAVAPNGAITGAFPQRVTAEQLTGAFVTPAMAACMKSMQQGRVVFLCVQAGPQPFVPAGVNDFLADPQFKDRGDVVFVHAADPAEAQLLAELGMNTTEATQVNTVFFAPPGVIVGKFGLVSTKVEIAAALHKAGKCCDDPNCKHGHAAQPGGTVR